MGNRVKKVKSVKKVKKVKSVKKVKKVNGGDFGILVGLKNLLCR